MVVTEALARGIPVLASAVGGVPDALGYAATGDRPGVLVPPEDPAALATALRQWWDDPTVRTRLRAAAAQRRADLDDWTSTTNRIGMALKEAMAW